MALEALLKMGRRKFVSVLKRGFLVALRDVPDALKFFYDCDFAFDFVSVIRGEPEPTVPCPSSHG